MKSGPEFGHCIFVFLSFCVVGLFSFFFVFFVFFVFFFSFLSLFLFFFFFCLLSFFVFFVFFVFILSLFCLYLYFLLMFFVRLLYSIHLCDTLAIRRICRYGRVKSKKSKRFLPEHALLGTRNILLEKYNLYFSSLNIEI